MRTWWGSSYGGLEAQIYRNTDISQNVAIESIVSICPVIRIQMC